MAGLKKMMGYLNMDDTKRYNNFVKMDHEMLEEMLNRPTSRIQKQNTNMRRALEPELKLAIRPKSKFLATGDSYVSLGYGFRVALKSQHYAV